MAVCGSTCCRKLGFNPPVPATVLLVVGCKAAATVRVLSGCAAEVRTGVRHSLGCADVTD